MLKLYSDMLELSIILPVHNESEVIKRTIQEIEEALSGRNISFEILCIENGSTDNSSEIIKYITKKNKKVKLFSSSLGWGNAVREGIRHADGKYSIYMVSDGQVHAAILPKLYKRITEKKIDLVKIKRITRENNVRYINSRLFNTTAFLFLGVKSYDINGTPKIALTSLLKKIPFISPNISFDLELLLYLKKNKLKWEEIPVKSFRRKGGKSTTNWKAVAEMYFYILKFLGASL